MYDPSVGSFVRSIALDHGRVWRESSQLQNRPDSYNSHHAALLSPSPRYAASQEDRKEEAAQEEADAASAGAASMWARSL